MFQQPPEVWSLVRDNALISGTGKVGIHCSTPHPPTPGSTQQLWLLMAWWICGETTLLKKSHSSVWDFVCRSKHQGLNQNAKDLLTGWCAKSICVFSLVMQVNPVNLTPVHPIYSNILHAMHDSIEYVNRMKMRKIVLRNILNVECFYNH